MTKGYRIVPVHSQQDLERILPEWEDFFVSNVRDNPLAHPRLLSAWSRNYVGPDDLLVLFVRSKDDLVGVAPFFRHRLGFYPFTVTSLQLLGTGPDSQLIELPAIMSRSEETRAVFRELFHYLGTRASEWDWIDVTLSPTQGWFEPQWLPPEFKGGSFVFHKGTRPCVVMDLPRDRDALMRSLKRNVRESVRRSANRLAKGGHSYTFATPSDSEFERALEILVALHSARSRVPGKLNHPDVLKSTRVVEFLTDAGRLLHGDLVPSLLHVDDEPVAGRLIMCANHSAYLLTAGFDPRWWEYGVATTLMVECLRWLIDRGFTRVNLSTGVDVAKLRWSEEIHLYQDFLVVNRRRRSRLAFGAYWQLRSAALLRRERAMQQRRSGMRRSHGGGR